MLMIGAVVYILRAENEALLSTDNGRYMHAAFLRLLERSAPELTQLLHDEQYHKPFSVSGLRACSGSLKSNPQRVMAGELFEWRIAALHEVILQHALSVQRGQRIKAGGLQLTVQEVIADGEQNPRSGVVDEEMLLSACLSVTRVNEMRFRFLSPTTFRTGQSDWPWPAPELIFSSLTAKWEGAGLPGKFDQEFIHEAARILVPLDWSGKTRRVRFDRDRWTLCFTGDFSYDASGLDDDQTGALLCLAQFGVFSGVGRMTTQGLGEVEVTYR